MKNTHKQISNVSTCVAADELCENVAKIITERSLLEKHWQAQSPTHSSVEPYANIQKHEIHEQ